MVFGSPAGLSIRIDNSQYINPDVTIDKTTGAFEVASSQPDVDMISLQGTNANDLITIGRNFFSAAYIMVNYDAGEFTIWPANPTATQDLVAVDSTGAEITSICSASNKTSTVTAGGASSSQTDGTTSDTSSGSSAASPKVSVPAIVGGVVGGVAGLAALSLVAWYLLRKRRNTDENAQIPELDAALRSFAKDEGPGSRSDMVHELAQSPCSVPELPTQGRDSGYASWLANSASYELAGGNVVHEMQ